MQLKDITVTERDYGNLSAEDLPGINYSVRTLANSLIESFS